MSMSREIKFRGKRIDNGEWVYGSFHYEEVECEKQYFKDGANNHTLGIDIRPVIEVDDDSSGERLSDYVVIPKTVGQFTGLKDKNGKEIYEGDILRYVIIDEGKIELIPCEVYFDMGAFFMKDTRLHGRSDLLSEAEPEDIEVVGNVHECPNES